MTERGIWLADAVQAQNLATFVERGYTATRLEQVAERAGVSKGTLYLYFNNKEALFQAAVRESITPLIEQAEQGVDYFTIHAGVLLRHALRNAAVPVITVIGSGFALLISGVVVTESVFNLPGIGRLTVDAVLARDYPVIQAMILLTSGIYVGVNLLIDVAYTLLDPRIRY